MSSERFLGDWTATLKDGLRTRCWRFLDFAWGYGQNGFVRHGAAKGCRPVAPLFLIGGSGEDEAIGDGEAGAEEAAEVGGFSADEGEVGGKSKRDWVKGVMRGVLVSFFAWAARRLGQHV